MSRSLHTAGWLGSRPGRAPSTRTFWGLAQSSTPATRHYGFTLVEMLVAMAITLVMMAAVATLFANVSNSVRNRRATIEMSGQVRHVRNVLQQDLQGATCPGITWQRPESNHGYIEIIEGQYRDSFPSMLTDGNDDSDGDKNPGGNPDELSAEQSIVPRANDGTLVQMNGLTVLSTVNGLGDYDDILMLTVRNENEPFVGRVPADVRSGRGVWRFGDSGGGGNNAGGWGELTMESPLAEVVWFAVENPDEDNSANNFFGEPGMRTIYRRTLLIAPWVNPYRATSGSNPDTFDDDGTFKAEPGLVRLLRDDVDFDEVADALAALVAFQDRYDLSVRLEWDQNIGEDGRWKIVANTLGDLTKRENRFGHFGFRFATGAGNSSRIFPYAMVSYGSGYSGSNADVAFVTDPEIGAPTDKARATANMQDAPPLMGLVFSYSVEPDNYSDPLNNRRYRARPFAYVDDTPDGVPATANAMLNDEGQVVRVVHGPVPLWGTRRGEDVMMTDALAFDLRVYDPGAPLYQENTTGTVLEPSDPGWKEAYNSTVGNAQAGFAFIGQGAYVDMGCAFGVTLPSVAAGASWSLPWFAEARALSDVFGRQLAPGYAVYDTWSFHYENNGVNDDGDLYLDSATNQWLPLIDEGTNGLDDRIPNGGGDILKTGDHAADVAVLGPDDVGERETAPPYDKPLRGMQVLVRVYERDSRAIRQVRVNQHFMPE